MAASPKLVQWTLRLILVLALIGAAVLLNMSRLPRLAVGEGRQVKREGVAIGYAARGVGPLVVLVPSLGRAGSDFNELVLGLNTAGYRTVALDPRGVGKSGPARETGLTLHDFAQDIEAVVAVEARLDERVVVIGHAYGNRVARAYATDFPSRVRALVLFGAGGKVKLDPEVHKALVHSFWTFLPDFWRCGPVRFAFFADGHDVPLDWRVGWSIPTAKMQEAVSTVTPFEEWWAGGTAPMLIVQGMQDRVAPPVYGAKLIKAEFGERVTVVEIEGAGHALLPEQPAAVETAVKDFLAAIPAE